MKTFKLGTVIFILSICQTILVAEEPSTKLKLPDFPEGTAPSQRAIDVLNRKTDVENGVLAYREKDPVTGKMVGGTAKFYKLPDNEVTWKYLNEMDGFAIAFNEFIPLPKYEPGRKRKIHLSTEEGRHKNSFGFGGNNFQYENCTITIKDNTNKTRYLMKGYAFKFRNGFRAPGPDGYSDVTFSEQKII